MIPSRPIGIFTCLGLIALLIPTEGFNSLSSIDEKTLNEIITPIIIGAVLGEMHSRAKEQHQQEEHENEVSAQNHHPVVLPLTWQPLSGGHPDALSQMRALQQHQVLQQHQALQQQQQAIQQHQMLQQHQALQQQQALQQHPFQSFPGPHAMFPLMHQLPPMHPHGIPRHHPHAHHHMQPLPFIPPEMIPWLDQQIFAHVFRHLQQPMISNHQHLQGLPSFEEQLEQFPPMHHHHHHPAWQPAMSQSSPVFRSMKISHLLSKILSTH